MIKFIQLSICLFVSLVSVEAKAQVSNACDTDQRLFLSADKKGKKQWICGFVLSASDTANQKITARFDVMKDWVPVDSLEIALQLDTTRLYRKTFRDDEIEVLRYFSPSGLEVFLQVPEFHTYTSNEMELTSCSYDYAIVVFHREWRKYQKRFDQFFEK